MSERKYVSKLSFNLSNIIIKFFNSMELIEFRKFTNSFRVLIDKPGNVSAYISLVIHNKGFESSNLDFDIRISNLYIYLLNLKCEDFYHGEIIQSVATFHVYKQKNINVSHGISSIMNYLLNFTGEAYISKLIQNTSKEDFGKWSSIKNSIKEIKINELHLMKQKQGDYNVFFMPIQLFSIYSLKILKISCDLSLIFVNQIISIITKNENLRKIYIEINGKVEKRNIEMLFESIASLKKLEILYLNIVNTLSNEEECTSILRNLNKIKTKCIVFPDFNLKTNHNILPKDFNTQSPKIKLPNSNISNKDLETLLQMNNLQNLNFRKSEIDLTGVKIISEFLKSNKTLLSLNLSQNPLTAGGFIEISNSLKLNKSLTKLNVSNCYITSSAIKHSTSLFTSDSIICNINMSMNPLIGEGLIFLKGFLKKNTSLTKLNLSSVFLLNTKSKERNDISKFLDFCQGSSNFKKFDFSNNPVDDLNFNSFINNIKKNESLNELNLSNISITRISCDMLYKKKTRFYENLTDLNLSKNKIGDEGLFVISDFIQRLLMLRNLNLAEVDSKDKGIASLFPAIANLKSLKKLNISHNHLKDGTGLKAICLYLSQNKNLEVFDLSQISFSVDNTKLLKESLLKNMTLKTLLLSPYIKRKHISYPMQSILDALKENCYINLIYI
jgi:Ran GTPase-activating protein (RanGAP) involved in mRNA processing and transport